MTKAKRKDELIHWRARQVGNYIVENDCTIRQCAKALKVSKSTVHKDTFRLKDIDIGLYHKVRKILERNKEERAQRGGDSTRRKYKGKKIKKVYPKNLTADWIDKKVVNN